MKSTLPLPLIILLLGACSPSAATLYVSSQCSNPNPPYATWATAATTIQDAVDAAVPGDTILVTNGVYASGWRAAYDSIPSRVVVEEGLTVRSVNGPGVTVIAGGVRCAYVGTNAVLSGFTLTNGYTTGLPLKGNGGGAWCEMSALLTNCVLTANWAADSGGGVYGGTLNDCTLIGNSAFWAGGAYGATLNRCVLSGNSATNQSGGGAYGGTLNNCILIGNSALYGGGVFADANGSSATLNNCVLIGNSATQGGGVYVSGGGILPTLNNCTLIGNSADQVGGAYGGILNNCIVYYNTPANYLDSTLTYSCTG